MTNKKFEVAVSGIVTVWAENADKATDMVHELCSYAGDSLNSDSLMHEEGYVNTDLTINENGVTDTGETDE